MRNRGKARNRAIAQITGRVSKAPLVPRECCPGYRITWGRMWEKLQPWEGEEHSDRSDYGQGKQGLPRALRVLSELEENLRKKGRRITPFLWMRIRAIPGPRAGWAGYSSCPGSAARGAGLLGGKVIGVAALGGQRTGRSPRSMAGRAGHSSYPKSAALGAELPGGEREERYDFWVDKNEVNTQPREGWAEHTSCPVSAARGTW